MTCRRSIKIALLLLCTASITACPTERFRHETYECNSGAFGIAKIILNDTDVGDMATIIGYGNEEKAEIQSSSRASVTLKSDDIKIAIERQTGNVKIQRGNHIAVFSCFKTVFKM